MPALWVTFFAAAVGFSDGYSPDTSAKPDAKAVSSPANSPRQGYELRDAVRLALRQWARPSDDEAPRAAQQFLILYQELQTDTQLARTQRDTLRTQVRTRLAQLSDQISYRIAREKRLAKSEQPKSVSAPADKTAPLAQQMGGAAGMAPGAGMGPRGAVRPGTIPDAGQDLVDLIQRVIAPKSWDVNGGPGSIYYWQPGHALIIRQTSEVHGQIGDTLEQLRRLEQ